MCRGFAEKCNWGDERDLVPRRQEELTEKAADGVVTDISDRVLRRIHESMSENTAVRTVDVISRIILGDQQPESFNTAKWRHIMCLLPDKAGCSRIVAHYIRWIEPLTNCFNRDLLDHQLKLFWQFNENFQLCIRKGSLEVPSEAKSFWEIPSNWGFVALLFAIVHTTACSVTPQVLRDLGILIGNEGQEKLGAYLDGALFFLSRSNHMTQPSLWTLQAMILIRDHFHRVLQARTLALWTSCLIRLAQTMGIHRLGSTVDDIRRQWDKTNGQWCGDKFQPMLYDFWPHNQAGYSEGLLYMADSIRLRPYIWHQEFEPGNLAMREIGRKIWHNLLAFDWQASAYLDHCYAVNESNSYTDPPAAIDDKQVIRLDTDKNANPGALEQVIANQSFSDNTYLRVFTHVARIIRMQVDMENKQHVFRGESRLSDSDISALDNEYRLILQQLTLCFENGSRLYSRMQLQSLNILTYYRLLRLHFPYLSIGLREVTHRKYAEACIDAARNVIKAYIKIEAELEYKHGFSLMILRLFIAVLSLHVALCRGQDLFPSDKLRFEIIDAVKALLRCHSNGLVREIDFLDTPVAHLRDFYLKAGISGAIIGDESIEQEDPLGWLPILDSRDFMINIDGLNELWSAGDGVVNGSHGTVDF